MIKYDDIKQKVNEYNSELQERVDNTKKLTSIQNFSMQNIRKKSKEEKRSNLEIYKDEYKKIDRITESHVARGVSDISRVFSDIGLKEDYVNLAKISHELHDIGRRPQYVETGTTVDMESYNRTLHQKRGISLCLPDEIVNHATHGVYLLDDFLFDYLNIPHKYREIVRTSVLYHSSNRLPNGLDVRVPEELFNNLSLDEAINDITYYTNIVRLFTQAVKSVDNFDLNNKLLNGSIPIYREKFGLDVEENDTLETFSKIWGVSKQKLRDCNHLSQNEELKPGQVIYIPTREVPLEKMKVNDDYIKMLKEDSFPDKIGTLQTRKDYSFLSAQVWRLSLLRNIDFKSLLTIIKDDKMLEKMLKMYDEYQNGLSELMRPAFDYAKEEIIEKALNNQKSKIYTPKRK